MINLRWLWHIIPLNRSFKEGFKGLIYTLFSKVLFGFDYYRHWKNAQIFADEPLSVFTLRYWRKALINSYKINVPLASPMDSVIQPKLAVIIHAFYVDVFKELILYVKTNIDLRTKLFVTTLQSQEKEVKSILNEAALPYKIIIVDNRGRDILPFIKTMPYVLQEEFEILLKLHTKKSLYVKNSDEWRRDLLEKLIGTGQVKQNINVFTQNPLIGMIGPAGHNLPMHLYYGSNPEKVIQLSRKMGLVENDLKGLNFVAGSMFYARTKVFEPLLDLKLKDFDFEYRDLDHDGSLAHAVERAFAASLLKAGYYLADTNYNPEKSVIHITTNHKFTL